MATRAQYSTPEGRAYRNLWRAGPEHVCAHWKGRGGIERFIAEVGPRPSEKHQLQRPDPTKPYAPGNAAWGLPNSVRLTELHSNYRHGRVGSKTWNSWLAMRRRCLDPKNNRYPMYGGRGITVCERWLGRDGFAAFLADMGEKPAGTSIDRIDVNGNYEPSNCRWATSKQQARNTRATKLEEHEPGQIRWLLSEGYTQTEIARHFEVSQSTVSLIALGKTWTEDASV